MKQRRIKQNMCYYNMYDKYKELLQTNLTHNEHKIISVDVDFKHELMYKVLMVHPLLSNGPSVRSVKVFNIFFISNPASPCHIKHIHHGHP